MANAVIRAGQNKAVARHARRQAPTIPYAPTRYPPTASGPRRPPDCPPNHLGVPAIRLHVRLGLVALSLLLPLVLAVVVLACFHVLTARGDHDRALLWVQGTPAQLQALRERVLHHEVFVHGEAIAGGHARHRPEACARDSTAISFSRLRDFELAAAHDTLDALARDVGTQVCRGHAFVFNDLPNPLDAAQWADSLVSLLLVLLIPTGSVAVVYWAASQQHGLPSPWRSPAPAARAWATGLAGAAVAFIALQAAAQATRTFAPWLGPDITGWQPATLSPAVFLLAGLYSPFLTELAFRGWLVPIASRAVGTVPAALLSALAGAALPWPDGPGDALASLAFGGVMAAVFLRTRSVPACVIAHGGCAVLSLLAGTGA